MAKVTACGSWCKMPVLLGGREGAAMSSSNRVLVTKLLITAAFALSLGFSVFALSAGATAVPCYWDEKAKMCLSGTC